MLKFLFYLLSILVISFFPPISFASNLNIDPNPVTSGQQVHITVATNSSCNVGITNYHNGNRTAGGGLVNCIGDNLPYGCDDNGNCNWGWYCIASNPGNYSVSWTARGPSCTTSANYTIVSPGSSSSIQAGQVGQKGNNCSECIIAQNGGNQFLNFFYSQGYKASNDAIVNHWCGGGVSQQASSDCKKIIGGACFSACGGKTSSCAACVIQQKGGDSFLNFFRSNGYNNSDDGIVNHWCTEVSADASSECGSLLSGVCASSCGGSPSTPASEPAISIPTQNQGTLTGSQQIQIQAPQKSVVDLQLQTTSGSIGSLFVGRAKVDNSQGQTTLNWDSKNVPNGDYRLYGTIPGEKTPLIVGPVPIKVDNSLSAVKKLEALQSSSSSAAMAPLSPSDIVTATTKDIVFPSLFDPKKVPVKADTTIQKIANTKNTQRETVITFSGKAVPNTILTLLIYSEPIVVTVKTDANGVWSYNLDKPLSPGEHSAYIVVPQEGGVQIRSEVANFSIAPAYAASANSESLVLASTPEEHPLERFAFITALIVISGVALLLIVFRFKKVPSSDIEQL